MKRYILVAIVLFAAFFAIWFMVTKWEEKELEQVNDTSEEREILGLSSGSGSAASEDESTPQTDTRSDTATGSAVSESAVTLTELEQRSSTYTGYITKGMTEKVLEDASGSLKKSKASDLDLSFESVVSGLGKYIGIESSKEEKNGSYKNVTVTLRYEGNDGASIRYVYDEDSALVGLWFDNTRLAAQAESGSAYDEMPIKIGRTPYVLDGVLTLPLNRIDEKKKPPVVILISDKNDMDMDGTIGRAANKPLRDVAHALATRGVASIRYNKRLFQYPDTAGANAGIREYLTKDAGMAIDTAGFRNEIDTDAIYVLAWGESAEYLPAIIEKRIRRIHGVVMVGAKPTKHEVIDYKDEAAALSSDAKYFVSKAKSIHMCFLQGDKDFETPTDNLEKWQSLLTGRVNTTFYTYKALGHYLTMAGEKSDASDYDVKGQVSSYVVSDLANWCVSNMEKEE